MVLKKQYKDSKDKNNKDTPFFIVTSYILN